jgi:hypothetical protein
VGNIELAPTGIIEANVLGACRIPAVKAPVVVKRLIAPMRRRRRVEMLGGNRRMLFLPTRTLRSEGGGSSKSTESNQRLAAIELIRTIVLPHRESPLRNAYQLK